MESSFFNLAKKIKIESGFWKLLEMLLVDTLLKNFYSQELIRYPYTSLSYTAKLSKCMVTDILFGSYAKQYQFVYGLLFLLKIRVPILEI